MTPFTFRLQRLLEIRQRTEQEVATRLVHANSSAEAARQTRLELTSVRQAGRERLVTASAAPVGMLQNLSFVLARLDERLDAAHTQVNAAETDVARVEGELREAFQARRVLDKLRERRLDEWKTVAASDDRATMDAIALTRHTQRPSSADPS